jgi:high-affinity iron transporter
LLFDTRLKAINMAALFAAVLAIVVCAAVTIPLALLSKEFNDDIGIIIEGVSKVVASICVLQLSLKIPKFLGVYPRKKGEDGQEIGLSLKSIRFNVAWNLWREIAECGVFLLPFFLTGEGARAIPLSGLIGIAVGGVLGLIIYYANKLLKNTAWLAFFMAALLLFLSVGLFVGGCHEFEEVYGETTKIYNIGVREVVTEGRALVWEQRFLTSEDVPAAESTITYERTIWSEKQLPFALLKPFGYSAGRTQLQIACFWSWLTLGCVLHAWKYVSAKKIREAQELAAEEKAHPSMVKSLQSKETAGMSDHISEDVETASGGSNPEVDPSLHQDAEEIEA